MIIYICDMSLLIDNRDKETVILLDMFLPIIQYIAGIMSSYLVIIIKLCFLFHFTNSF